ncbi:hypothetical protein LPMP_252210 [Leishmania panamensis]|uniref:Translation initiation factor, putative n=1 Tax=Leishmania panamensis TaxID=5679 RepID=A0A088RUZ4_LEIPA|nr:hypothetical protein LPMP_252210 [Leishmania panamensis]AIN99084.1 hypothetical protein LPMP_252210 [Leishmania panamensis]
MDNYDNAEHDNFGYEDDEYDDAADDWEIEAAEEEQKAIAEEAARKARLEKKLVTRAPVKKEEEEEAVPEDVERAIADMRQVANDIASGSTLLRGGSSEELIGNHKLVADVDVDRVGAMIADRLTSFSESSHYDKLILEVFERLTSHLTNTQLLNEEADRVHRLREELKRAAKTKTKPVEKAPVTQSSLDLSNFEDKGGAAVTEENEDETGW